jgi:Protein of unknown function (DUF3352)
MTDDFSSQPTYDVLAAAEPESRRKPATWWVVGGVVVLVGALIGGITYGAASLSGGGAQPEDALPAGAVAFAKVDLDPAASQKVDAIRFLRKFPSLRGRLAGDGDLRKVLFDAVAGDAGWDHVNFAADVEPWLGQRVGVAAYSPKTFAAGTSTGGPQAPTVVVALQVSDEGKARDGLDRLIAASSGSSKPGYVVQDGYALLAESKPLATSAADAVEAGTLAGASTFAADIKGLDDGIMTSWVDGAAASSLSSVANLAGVGLPDVAGVHGSALSRARLVSSLRFDGPDVLEIAGRVTGAPAVAGPNVAVQGLADLPATTVAALGLGGGDGLVDSAWKAMRKQVDSSKGAGSSVDDAVGQAEKQYGLHLPDDLKLLLGSNLLLALDRTGLDDHTINAGARVTTSDPKRANSLIGRLTGGLAGQVPGVVHQVTGDGFVLASSRAQADRLTQPAGGKRLGDLDAFRRALPDVDAARFALWVDPQSVYAGLRGGAVVADLKPIAGFGLTATSDGSGNGSFRARLVTR